jgi:hypothetical protein
MISILLTEGSGIKPGTVHNETHMAGALARLEAQLGDPLAALEYSAVAIRNYHDSGNTTHIRAPWLPSPPFSTSSDTTNQRPPSPASRSTPSQ